MRLTYFSHAETLSHLVHRVGLPEFPLVRQQRPSTLARLATHERRRGFAAMRKLRQQLSLCRYFSAWICGGVSGVMAHPCSASCGLVRGGRLLRLPVRRADSPTSHSLFFRILHCDV